MVGQYTGLDGQQGKVWTMEDVGGLAGGCIVRERVGGVGGRDISITIIQTSSSSCNIPRTTHARDRQTDKDTHARTHATRQEPVSNDRCSVPSYHQSPYIINNHCHAKNKWVDVIRHVRSFYIWYLNTAIVLWRNDDYKDDDLPRPAKLNGCKYRNETVMPVSGMKEKQDSGLFETGLCGISLRSFRYTKSRQRVTSNNDPIDDGIVSTLQLRETVTYTCKAEIRQINTFRQS